MYEMDHLDTKREAADTIRSTAPKKENRPPAYINAYGMRGGIPSADVRFYDSRGSEDPGRYQPRGYLQENHASIPKQTAPGIRQDIVQRVLLKETGLGTYTECENGEKGKHINTEELPMDRLFCIMERIDGQNEHDLIQKIGDELLEKFMSLNIDEKTEEIRYFLGWLLGSEKKAFIMNALSDNFCKWLFSIKTQMPEIQEGVDTLLGERQDVQVLLERQAYVQIRQGNRPIRYDSMHRPKITSWNGPKTISLQPVSVYERLYLQMSELEMLFDQIKGSVGKKESYDQLLQLVAWKLVGYQQLMWRYANDLQMQGLHEQFKNLENRFLAVTKKESLIDFLQSLTPSVKLRDPQQEQSRARFPNYEAEDMHLVGLPEKKMLPTAINNNYYNFLGTSIVQVANGILAALQQARSKEKLVLYRGMDASEAIEILKIFNTAKQSEVERRLSEGEDVTHESANCVAPIGWKDEKGKKKGGHLGDRIQAETYNKGDVNVTLAFILKEGAREILFSKALLTVGEKVIESSGFGGGNPSQGWNRNGIGINAEERGIGYSVAVAGSNKSKLILQLCVDRVQIVSIWVNKQLIYTEWP